jgi:hypothetical protein
MKTSIATPLRLFSQRWLAERNLTFSEMAGYRSLRKKEKTIAQETL